MALSYLSKNKSEAKPAISGLCVREVLTRATKLLSEIGIDNPMLDARLLMEQTLECTSLELILTSQNVLRPQDLEYFYSLLARRLCFEPIAYIRGNKEFFGYEFMVSKDCLIPRPDSESVVEQCLSLLKNKSTATLYDIGTGSGALCLSMLKEHPGLRAIASDLCENALVIAQKNAKMLALGDRVSFLQGDLFEPFYDQPLADLIVSNPPYIALKDLETLAPDVKNYEPHMALAPGDEHGIALYRRLIDQACGYLHDGGFLVLEIGFNQGDMVSSLAHDRLRLHGIFHDLAGNARVVVLKKN